MSRANEYYVYPNSIKLSATQEYVTTADGGEKYDIDSKAAESISYYASHSSINSNYSNYAGEYRWTVHLSPTPNKTQWLYFTTGILRWNELDVEISKKYTNYTTYNITDGEVTSVSGNVWSTSIYSNGVAYATIPVSEDSINNKMQIRYIPSGNDGSYSLNIYGRMTPKRTYAMDSSINTVGRLYYTGGNFTCSYSYTANVSTPRYYFPVVLNGKSYSNITAINLNGTVYDAQSYYSTN